MDYQLDNVIVSFTFNGEIKTETINSTSIVAACIRINQLYKGCKILNAQII